MLARSLSNGPSKLHVWRVKSQHVDVCERCGDIYHHRVGGNAAFYCFPSRDWLANHPDDDSATHLKDGARQRSAI